MKKASIFKISFVLFLVTFLVLPVFTNGKLTAKAQETRKVACIMTAFPGEMAMYKIALTNATYQPYARRNFLVGDYGDHWQVVSVIGGVGLSNAASSTQLMFDKFNCDVSFFSGIDGAVDPTIRVGDLVVPEKLAFHDYQDTIEVESNLTPIWVGKDESLQAVAQRLTGNASKWNELLAANEEVLHGNPNNLKPGMLLINPFDAPSGVVTNYSPSFKKVSYFSGDGITTSTIYLPVDTELLQVARTVATKHAGEMPIWTPPNGTPYQVQALVGGTVVSGDQFIISEFYRRYLATKFENVKGLEMEGAAFAQTCMSNGKRCLVTRTASDLSRALDWWNPIPYSVAKMPVGQAFADLMAQKRNGMFAGGVSSPFAADLSAKFNLWMLDELAE